MKNAQLLVPSLLLLGLSLTACKVNRSVTPVEIADRVRFLDSGKERMKKDKTEPEKDKLSKKFSMTGNDKDLKAGKQKMKDVADDDNQIDGKSKVKKDKKGMMSRMNMKGKMGRESPGPKDIATNSPSSTVSPMSVTSVAPAQSPTVAAPASLETDRPSETFEPSILTETPGLTTTVPTVQPILIAPTNFVFVGSSNILVNYQSMNDTIILSFNETIAAIDLTCEYVRIEAIDPLGALQFACLWFLPTNASFTFPVDITYSINAAFSSDVTNITTEVLDASIVSALTVPRVKKLIESFNTQLPSDNTFVQTEMVSAVV
jgi:hypothetical protein